MLSEKATSVKPSSAQLNQSAKPSRRVFVEEASLEVFPSEEDDTILTVNISGMRFQVTSGTLGRFPETLLGDPRRRKEHFNHENNEYFFERSRSCFDSILYYYQSSGVLCCPRHVPPRIFHEEVQFFLGNDVAKPFESFGGKYSNDFGDDKSEVVTNKTKQRLRYMDKMWSLFENPNSSIAAKILAVWSLFIIALSVATFCIETLPNVRDSPSCVNTTIAGGNVTKSADHHCGPFFIIESVCIVWFTIELICRFILCPDKINFVKDFLNVIDLVAILPYYITLPLSDSEIASLAIIRVIRLIRIFRVFKLSRYSKSLVILARTLWESAAELSLLLLFLSFGVILFASAIYYAEHEVNSDHFTSIPDAFWWATITMTTVGYGDKYPVTVVGKFIGAACAIVGVLFVALPVPIIVQNFTTLYEMERDLAARKASKPRRQKQKQPRHYVRHQRSEDATIIEDFRDSPLQQQNSGTGDDKQMLSDEVFDFALSDRRRADSCAFTIDTQNDVHHTCPHCGSTFRDCIPRRSSSFPAPPSLASMAVALRKVNKAQNFDKYRQNGIDILECQSRYTTGNATGSSLRQTLTADNAIVDGVAVAAFQDSEMQTYDGDSALRKMSAKSVKLSLNVESSV